MPNATAVQRRLLPLSPHSLCALAVGQPRSLQSTAAASASLLSLVAHHFIAVSDVVFIVINIVPFR